MFHTGLKLILKSSQFLFCALFQDEQHVSLVQALHVDQGICLHLYFVLLPQCEIQLLLKCFSCLLFQYGHGYLTETLGIPVWGSYAVFGLATLFLGMVLGLVSEILGAGCDFVTLVLPPPQLWAGVLGYPELHTWSPHNPWVGFTCGEMVELDLQSLFQPKQFQCAEYFGFFSR